MRCAASAALALLCCSAGSCVTVTTVDKFIGEEYEVTCSRDRVDKARITINNHEIFMTSFTSINYIMNAQSFDDGAEVTCLGEVNGRDVPYKIQKLSVRELKFCPFVKSIDEYDPAVVSTHVIQENETYKFDCRVPYSSMLDRLAWIKLDANNTVIDGNNSWSYYMHEEMTLTYDSFEGVKLVCLANDFRFLAGYSHEYKREVLKVIVFKRPSSTSASESTGEATGLTGASGVPVQVANNKRSCVTTVAKYVGEEYEVTCRRWTNDVKRARIFISNHVIFMSHHYSLNYKMTVQSFDDGAEVMCLQDVNGRDEPYKIDNLSVPPHTDEYNPAIVSKHVIQENETFTFDCSLPDASPRARDRTAWIKLDANNTVIDGGRLTLSFGQMEMTLTYDSFDGVKLVCLAYLHHRLPDKTDDYTRQVLKVIVFQRPSPPAAGSAVLPQGVLRLVSVSLFVFTITLKLL